MVFTYICLEQQHRVLGLGERTVTVVDLDMGTTVEHTILRLQGLVLGLGVVSETPLVGDDDVLTTRELVLGTTKTLDDVSLGSGLGTDGEDDLTDVDTGTDTDRLTESSSHSGLQTIGTGTGKHLVDTENVVWVTSDTHVEGLTTNVDVHVLVDDNTSSFQTFGTELFVLTRDKVDADREGLDRGLLASDIEDGNLRIYISNVDECEE